MASSSSQRFGSSGSNNPRTRRNAKRSAHSRRASSSARRISPGAPRNRTGDARDSSSIPLGDPSDISRGSSRQFEGRQTSRSVELRSRRADRKSGNAARRLTSRTIAEVNRDARRAERASTAERAKRSSHIPLIVIGAIVCVVIITVVALFLMSRTDALQIENIDIQGADHLTEQELSALASIPEGATLLNVDSDSIIKSLMRDSWVESVDVNRVFPVTLEIIIHEREVGAVVEVPTGNTQTIQNWLLSKDGVWLMAVPSKDSEVGSQISELIHQDADEALHITNVEFGVRPEIGAECTDDAILNAVSIINGLTTDLADQIKAVQAEDIESTTIILNSNVEIAVGSANNIREKELICLDIMENNPKVVYINVRVPDRPTWKKA